MLSVPKLEVYSGQKRNALLGAGIGFVMGAAVGIAAVAGTRDLNNCDPFTETECALLIGGIPGAVVGSLIGAVIGYSTKSANWKEVQPLKWSVLPMSNGRIAVNVSLRF